MAITSINITQDNTVGASNLLAAQSPLAFIAEVNYTGATPDEVNVELRDDTGTLLETYRAIPYLDLSLTQRYFVFKASQAVKALLGSFDDFSQLNNTLEYVEGLTKQLYIRFVDPDTPATYDEVLIDFAHAARQFGEDPNLTELFNNDESFAYAPSGRWGYLYFYNPDEANTVDFEVGALAEGDALEFDDSVFTDFDDDNFTILTF